jgi:hypothetical protein
MQYIERYTVDLYNATQCTRVFGGGGGSTEEEKCLGYPICLSFAFLRHLIFNSTCGIEIGIYFWKIEN